MEKTSSWDEVIELRKQLWDMLKDYWFNETLYSLNWWILLISTIGFIIVWLILLDRKRITEIITFGLMISVIGFVLDVTGIVMVLWSYPDRLFPVITPILEIHKADMPIVYMLVYQYTKTWKTYLIYITITAFTFAFIFEPILEWLEIYKLHNWKHIYSFPIFLALGIGAKWLMNKLKQIENSNKKQI